MSRGCAVLLAGVLAALLAPGPAVAQEPTVDEVLGRYRAALGGDESLAALQSLRLSGTYAYNGLEFPVRRLQQRGGRLREEIEGLSRFAESVLEGVVVVRATDGARAWTMGAAEAPEPKLLPGDAATALRLEAELPGPLVDPAAAGHVVELVGRAEVEGEELWHLRLTRASGTIENWYLGLEDYLPRRRDIGEVGMTRETLQQAFAWYFDDYRPVAGVLLPHWMLVEEPLFAREYVFETIEAGVEIDAGAFAPPESLAGEAAPGP